MHSFADSFAESFAFLQLIHLIESVSSYIMKVFRYDCFHLLLHLEIFGHLVI